MGDAATFRSIDPLHVRAQRDEILHEVGVRALDGVGVEDGGFALDAARHHQQGDGHADDVGAGHRRGRELVAAEGDQAVRVAQQGARRTG